MLNIFLMSVIDGLGTIWLLGFLFVLAVYFFPTGMVGKLRERADRARLRARTGAEAS